MKKGGTLPHPEQIPPFLCCYCCNILPGRVFPRIRFPTYEQSFDVHPVDVLSQNNRQKSSACCRIETLPADQAAGAVMGYPGSRGSPVT